MTAPSPDARHVRIGSNYRPTAFEYRDSHGTYSALMPRLGGHNLRLQAALIGRVERAPWPTLIVSLVLAVAVAAAAYLVNGAA